MATLVIVTKKALFNTRRNTWLVAIGCLLCAVTDVNAQTDTTSKLREISVKGILTPSQSVFLPAQSITADAFVKQSAFNVADAVRNFAGVNVRDYGGIGGLKTVSVRGMGAAYTGVLYNGLPLTDAQTGQIDLGRYYLNGIAEIKLYNAQPDELLMPARAFASAAVLSIKQARPTVNSQKSTRLNAGIATGSFGLFNPSLQWQQRINANTALVLNMYSIKANGKYHFNYKIAGLDTLGTRTNSDITARQADATIYHSFTDSSKLQAQVYYYYNDRGSPEALVPYASYTAQRIFNEDVFVQLGYKKHWGNQWAFKTQAKLSHNFMHYTDSTYLNNRGGANEHYTQREWFQTAALTYRLKKAIEFGYSSDLSLTDVDLDVYSYAFPLRLQLYNVLAANFSSGHFLAQANLLHTYLNDNTVTAAAAKSQSKFTPTFVLNYKPDIDGALSLRAYYKQTYRYPNLAEQYYYATLPRDIKPENARLYNFGTVYNKTLNSSFIYLLISTDIFYNNIADKIFTQPGRAADILSVRNIGKVNIYGTDVTVKTLNQLSASATITFSVAYTYQKALDHTDKNDSYYGDQIPYTPVHNASGNIGLTYKDWGINGNYSFTGQRYFLNNNKPQYRLPINHIADASVTKQLSWGAANVMAAIEINNILNNNYVVVNSYPMPPRSYRISLKYSL